MIEVGTATRDDVEALATSVELEVRDFNAQARGFFAAQGFGPMYARLRRPVA